MGWIEVISPGLYTSIQDMGRPGMAYYAIPRSGALDPESLRRANTILGKPADAAAIEMTILPPRLRFHSSAQICISGAGMRLTLDEKEIAYDTIYQLRAGALLGGRPAPDGGARAYLAIPGQPELPDHYGSFSSSENARLGFNQGRPLRKGMRLFWNEGINMEHEERPHPAEGMPGWKQDSIKIRKGPEYGLLDDASRKILETGVFCIHPDSNRMGARLTGPPLRLTDTLRFSVPVLPGFVQLTPSSQLIVLLNEAQTTGGYPRIAYLTDESRAAFAQIPLGKKFHFRLI